MLTPPLSEESATETFELGRDWLTLIAHTFVILASPLCLKACGWLSDRDRDKLPE